MSVSNSSATVVKSHQLIRTLSVCAKARRPAFTWGSPGIGKSDVHRQTARKLGARLIDVRASQLDAVDTRGVPYITQRDGNSVTRWAIPEMLPTGDEPVLMHFDELNAAPQSVQAALYQLFLDRALGDYVLPSNVLLFASGNLESDRAVVNRLSTALANRFVHFQLAVDNEAWEQWALGADVHEAVISFLRYKPDLLHKWDPRSIEKAQPTPRTWEYASDIYRACEADNDVGLELPLMTGTLGSAVGTEFAGFLQIFRTLPDPDSIIMAPTQAPLLEDVAVNWALCGALAKRATRGNIDRIIQYAERMRDSAHSGPEFMTCLVRGASLRHPEITSTRGFIRWASANQEIFQ
jgi:hypothetical protein